MGLRVFTFIVSRLKLKYLKLVFSETNSQHILNWNKTRTSWIKCKTDSQNETFIILHFCKYNWSKGPPPPIPCHQWVILSLSPPPGTTGSISKLKLKKKKKTQSLRWFHGTETGGPSASFLFLPFCSPLYVSPSLPFLDITLMTVECLWLSHRVPTTCQHNGKCRSYNREVTLVEML